MEYEINGKLIKKFETKIINDKFSFRKFIIEVDRQWNKEIQFQANNQNIELLDTVDIGDYIDIQFDIRCKEYKDNYYTTLLVKEIRATSYDL